MSDKRKAERERDAREMVDWLVGKGAGKQGWVGTHEDVADGLGWPVTKPSRIKRFVEENPSLGFAITLGRSDGKPMWVVSSPTDQIQGEAVSTERKTIYEGSLVLLWMLVRRWATEFVHYGNIANKRTPEAERARKTMKEHRKMLIAIQNLLQPMKRPNEAELYDYIDSVLDAF